MRAGFRTRNNERNPLDVPILFPLTQLFAGLTLKFFITSAKLP
jgi:hypothetical protein